MGEERHRERESERAIERDGWITGERNWYKLGERSTNANAEQKMKHN